MTIVQILRKELRPQLFCGRELQKVKMEMDLYVVRNRVRL